MADNITDAELRKELQELGMKNVGPITASTRSIYLKKLNHLRAAERKKNVSVKGRKTTKSQLSTFSSDEEEEKASEPPALSRTKRPTRQAQGRNTRTQNARPTPDPPQRQEQLSYSRPPLRSTRRAADEVEGVSRGTSSVGNKRTSLGRTLNATYSFNDSNKDDFNSSDSDDVDIYKEEDESTHEIGTNTSPALDSSGWNSSFSRPSSSVAGFSGGTPRTSTPEKRTDVSNRSSSSAPRPLTNNNIRNRYSARYSFGGQRNAAAGRQPWKTGYQSLTNLSQDETLSDEEDILQQGFKTRDDVPGYGRFTAHVSYVLVVLVGIFFISLGFMYWWGMTAPGDKAKNSDKLMICDGSDKSAVPPCYLPQEVDKALEAIHLLMEELNDAAVAELCGYKTKYTGGGLDKGQVEEVLKNKYQDAEKQMSVVVDLVRKNPHWGISIANSDKKTPAVSVYGAVWFTVDSPHMPVWCRVKRAVMQVFYQLLFVAAGLLVCGVVVLVLRYRRRHQDEETKEVYHLVERIIDIMKRHNDECQVNKSLEPYLAIPHVRDMLIPLQLRRKKQGVWDKSVKFLAANESRIREETQHVKGEEFAVWRWIGGFPSNGKNKVWQGQAFGENCDVGYNLLPYSPTNCLKIRNMFDADVECGQDWHIYVQDAILEKCKENKGILHLAVDKTSKEGCVYMKCTTPDAAGEAYRALHGWWFDGE
ncbi:inner nuclear membrane protein Man1-like [Lingula anatina]|uniref:LEM domain-containing protein 2 n=1 Tax=Lingula anatina TaxID=7574 RepID=A0A1S3IIA7_LINAN|nr:inner nuclear membrane protein Man1-like [Lingula anatina]|eukprot:XP_013397234.1 inner nuclear membrane protein Man1-like [Lingula anatina]